MIAFLEGPVVERGVDHVVVAVNGVGYDVAVPTSLLGALAGEDPVRLHTRLVVREDAMVLYGFGSQQDRALFDLLVGVPGVGPKLGLAFLSSLSAAALRRALVSGDAAALTVVPGVGTKLAQRVVVDLRDRLGGGGDLPGDGPAAETREALIALGLTPAEAAQALAGVEVDGRPTEELLRDALQRVGR